MTKVEVVSPSRFESITARSEVEKLDSPVPTLVNYSAEVYR